MNIHTLLSPPAFQLLAAIAGVAAYTLYYHKGEHHLSPHISILAVLGSHGVLTLLLKNIDSIYPTATPTPPPTWSSSLTTATLYTSIYLLALYTSLILYRLFLNPLNKFPGYPLTRLTSFDHASRVITKKNMFAHLYRSHKRWGKFVRIGPNDLSVSDADVVRVALGVSASCDKAPWYAFESPAYSVHTTRDRSLHDRRRRIWSPAFSDKALRGYETRVEAFNRVLVRKIGERFDGKPINISQWFNFWSFDVMGDLAFGQSFNMLESEKGHWAITLLEKGQEGAGWGLPPWVARLLVKIPGARRGYFEFLHFCASQIENRMKVQGKQANPDITHHLIEDFNAHAASRTVSEKAAEMARMQLDSKLIIVAGSDTTASTMTFLFYRLALEPGLLGRLREEVEGLVGDSGIDHREIQAAPLLNGCINETLRLHPAVPSGLYRKVRPEGAFVGKTWIPGDTTLLVHFYSMSRDESHYVDADKFIPERFSTRPELIKHKDAFVPFSTGPYGCIGKNLALMEIRLLTAHLITKFDVAFAPGEDGSELLKSDDIFTIMLKPLHLIFKKRTEGG
ncbi:cytochrome P450 [Aspergillus californicus]